MNINKYDRGTDPADAVRAFVGAEGVAIHQIEAAVDARLGGPATRPAQAGNLRGGDGTSAIGHTRVWGAWPTIGFTLLVLLLQLLVTILVTVGFIIAYPNEKALENPEVTGAFLETNGFYISLCIIISTPLCIAATVLFVDLRRGLSLKEYLGLDRLPCISILKWVGVIVPFMIIMSALGAALKAPQSEWTENVYDSSPYLPLLWIAIVLLGPIFEEILFRGFLFTGLRDSRLGPVGAIVLTSLGWALMHVQYDLFSIFVIFLFGLLLGTARWSSRSLYPCIALHIAMNLLQMVVLQLYV